MKHLNVVAAIIIHNGQILCMQRGQAKQRLELVSIIKWSIKKSKGAAT